MKLEVTEILRNNQWRQSKGIQAVHFVTSLILEKKIKRKKGWKTHKGWQVKSQHVRGQVND